MKNTAMQELWDVLNDAEQNGVYEIGTQNLKRYIEGMYLEQEKQQIIDANNAGWRTHRKKENQNAEDYYNETFKQ